MTLQGLGYGHSHGQLLVPAHCKQMTDSGETDSAFSDNSSLPSSESYTSMATVSSSTETTSSSSGETCSITSAVSSTTVMNEEEQMQRIKAEKIRIALEKIKEAKIRKLFVRAFAKDGSSKSILVDEKMTVNEVCSLLADKHHSRRTHSMAVVEHMPQLCMERILEDHDSLVETMVMWTRDSKNKVLFEERQEKYNLFFQPEKYLLPGSPTSNRELNANQKDRLIQDFFSTSGVAVPELEGPLYLKSDGKKTWKKYFFVLRASGLYYLPKGKANMAAKELVCLVQFEFAEVYNGLGWKKKYHSPTEFCFALKHPQIQKKTSKYIRYFCAESSTAVEQWIMGIRIAKLGKQMLHNFEHVHHEIATWDLVQNPTNHPTASTAAAITDNNPYSSPSRGNGGNGSHSSNNKNASRALHHQDSGDHYQALNPGSLQDSRLSMPEGAGGQHTVVKVHNSSSLVRSGAVAGGSLCYNPNEVVGMEVTTTTTTPAGPRHQRQGSEGGMDPGGGGHKTPTKRVSFCATHSVITTDSREQHTGPKHRDSIISDSSEDSNSSGEGRHSTTNALRGKMRPKLPVTTETTRFLTEMNQLSIDNDCPGREGPGMEETMSISSASSSSSSRQGFSRLDRRRASMTERRGSDGKRIPPVRAHSISGGDNSRRPLRDGSPGPLSPTWRQSGTQRWVEDYHSGGQDSMASLPEGSSQGLEACGSEDNDVFGDGGSLYQQIPECPHGQDHCRQQQHEQCEQRYYPHQQPSPCQQMQQQQQQQQQLSQQEKQYENQQQYQLLQQYRQQQQHLHSQQYQQRQQQQQQQQRGIQKQQQYYQQQQQQYHQHSQLRQSQHYGQTQDSCVAQSPPVQQQPQHTHQDANSELYATITSMKSLATRSKDDPSPDSDQRSESELLPEGEEDMLPPPPPPLLLESLAPLAPPPFHPSPKMCAPPTAPKPSSASPLSPPTLYKQRSLPLHPKNAPAHPGSCQDSPSSVSPGYHQLGDRTFPLAASRAAPMQVHGPGKGGPPTMPKFGSGGHGSDHSQGSVYYSRSISSPASAPQSLPVSCSVPHDLVVEEHILETRQGYSRYGRSVSSPPSHASCLSSSAPSSLTKTGFMHSGYYMEEARYMAMQHSPSLHSEDVPSSPHRASHTRQPSTGSPTVVMGANAAQNLRPSPSDSGFMEGDNISTCSVSPCNPACLHEFPRRLRDPSPGSSPPRPCLQDSEPSGQSASAGTHKRSASGSAALVKGAGKPDGGRKAPPPPPKRSETTRLSTDVAKHLTNTPPASPSTHSQPSQPPNPIYENCEGIVDINELPPPPPELLAGLPQSAGSKNAAARSAGPGSLPRKGGGGKQHKLPPPPPKRSKDTHLSHQSHAP